MATIVCAAIPAYQRDGLIEATLRSLQSQDYPDWQCVVVDDGSRDGTAAVAEKVAASDPRIRVVRQANAGVSAARNRGYRELSADCKYVTFMDGDDLWAPGALTKLVSECDKFPSGNGRMVWPK